MITIMSELIELVERNSRGHLALAAGDVLFRAGEPVVRLHLVVSGGMNLERCSVTGLRFVLQSASAGDIVAEPSIFADHYHCAAIAISDTLILFADVDHVRRAVLGNTEALERLARQFARDVQSARMRAEILTFHRLSDRLDAWLDLNGGVLPEKGQWLTLAAHLAVTPEALYRELAKRRRTTEPHRPEKLFRA